MHPGKPRGYTFVVVLLLLALLSLGLAAAGPVWSQQTQREREREMLRVGLLYAQAIAAYQKASPGNVKQYPPTIEALLLDARFVGIRRHLRKAYPDPVNASRAWIAVRNDEGRIVGVRSGSEAAPIAQGEVRLEDRVLAPAKRYSEWLFLAETKT